MVKKSYVLIGIIILGLFMFLSTLLTLENYSKNEKETNKITNTKLINYFIKSTNNSNILSYNTLKYLPINILNDNNNQTMQWNFDTNSFNNIFYNSSSFNNIFNPLSYQLNSNFDNDNNYNNNITSFMNLPSLLFVQNQTYNIFKLVGNEVKNRIYYYTNWNITENSKNKSLSSSSLSPISDEESIVKYFASNIQKVDSQTSKQ